MLAQQVIRETDPSRVRFVVEDLGNSKLADRFGIDKYPAIFVDDALVARPEDFYEWGTKETGRYMPWSEPAKRRAFQEDLRRFIGLRLAGQQIASLPAAQHGTHAVVLPRLEMTDLQGRRLELGQARLIEVWATWCRPCLESLPWLDSLPKDRVPVVAVAVESKREDVEKVVAKLNLRVPVVMATDELRHVLNGPPAVPALLLTDGRGHVVKTFYGAPPDLHAQVERALAGVGGGQS